MKARNVLIFSAVIIISCLSIRQVRFAWHYVMGNYFHFIEHDYVQSVEHYSYLFENPYMQQNPRLYFVSDAYALGKIRNFSQNRKSSGHRDLKKLVKKFPDNMYLNYLDGTAARENINIKNLDSVSLLCLKDENLNSLSLRTIRHFFNPKDMNRKWTALLNCFLEWQGNDSLNRKLTSLYPRGIKKIAFEKCSETCSVRSMLYGFFYSRLKQEQAALKMFNSQRQKMLITVGQELEKNSGFRIIQARQHRMSREIRELQKIYKSGYPPLAARLKTLGELNRRIFQMKQQEVCIRESRISGNMKAAEEKIAEYKKMLSVVSPRSDSLPEKIPQLKAGSYLPADSRLRAEELENLVHGDSVSILQADFNDSHKKNRFTWRRNAGNSGSFFGATYKGTFAMICFYSEKTGKHASGWSGVRAAKKITVEPGVYLIEFAYRTAELERNPGYFPGSGISHHQLPLTEGKWFRAVSVLSFNNESKTGYLRPLVRISAPGVLQIADFSIKKVGNQPFLDVKQMVAVSGESIAKNF